MEALRTKILVVDDKAANILALTGLLQEHQVEVLSALNAQDALALVLEHEFALALVDVQMPEVSGLELARLLRGTQRTRNIPIIFVTAAHGQSMFEGYEKGAVDFLYKPIEPRVLSSKVRVFIELDQQRKQLRQLKEAAEQASQAKTQFLSQLSHEIRTPLAAVLGYSELLAMGGTTDSQRDVYVQAIARNGQALAKLVDDVLDLSKVESGLMEVESRWFSLKELLGELALTFAYKAQQKRLQLVIQSAEGVPAQICSDELRIRQVLTNLLGNSFKFTQQGSVTLSVSYSPLQGQRLLCFRVQDSGCGMDEAAAAKVFQPFSQADLTTSRRFGGTGLGLSIARKMAQALGGDVQLLSTAPDLGSVFEFTLRADGEAPAGAEAEEATFPDRERSLTGFRVLVAEDHDDLAQLVSTHLLEAGAQVELVSTGEEALTRLLGTHSIDLVLLDMQMPDLDGYQTAKRLRASGFVSPIIALTASALSGDKQRCLDAGCTEYLSKPVERSVLLSTVQRILDHSLTRGQCVLLVEDNLLAGTAVKSMLEKLECRVELALNGRQALVASAQTPYDLVLTDLQLPDIDGRMLLDQLTLHPWTTVAAHTGSPAEEIGTSPSGRRFDFLLRKPASLAQLSRLLAAVARSKKA